MPGTPVGQLLTEEVSLMAPNDSVLDTAPVAGIAEPHQSAVAAILRAVGQGLCTAAEADLVIDRIRAHRMAVPVVSIHLPPTPSR